MSGLVDLSGVSLGDLLVRLPGDGVLAAAVRRVAAEEGERVAAVSAFNSSLPPAEP